MRRSAFRCLRVAASLWCTVAGWAQPAVMRELMDDVSTVESKVVALAKAAPVEKYTWVDKKYLPMIALPNDLSRRSPRVARTDRCRMRSIVRFHESAYRTTAGST